MIIDYTNIRKYIIPTYMYICMSCRIQHACRPVKDKTSARLQLNYNSQIEQFNHTSHLTSSILFLVEQAENQKSLGAR